MQSFNRPNLKYSVRPKKAKSLSTEVINVINQNYRNQSGIVYCLSRYTFETPSDQVNIKFIFNISQ